MAIERTDYTHAAGVFNVDVAGNRLIAVAQDGFRAIVRDGVGRYRLQTNEPIAYVEGICKPVLGLNQTGNIGAQITQPGIVLVNTYDADNNPIDVLQFSIEILQVATAIGPAGVEPPAPIPGGGPTPGAASVTTLTVAIDYYVNDVSGLDSNDGLTPLTAWQTLARVQEAIGLRILRANVRVHLATGVYTLPSLFGAYGYEGGALTLADDVFNVVAADVAASNLGFPPYNFNTTAPGNLRGLMMRVTDGAGIDQIRMIQNNSPGVSMEISAFIPGFVMGDGFEVFQPATSVSPAIGGTTLRGAPMTQTVDLAFVPTLNFFNVDFTSGYFGDRTMIVEGRVAAFACTHSSNPTNTIWQPTETGALLLGLDSSFSTIGPGTTGFSSTIGYGVYGAGLGTQRDFTPVGFGTGNVRGFLNPFSSQTLVPGATAQTLFNYGLSMIFGGRMRGGQSAVRVSGKTARLITAVANASPIVNSLVINNTSGIGAPDTAGIVVVEDGATLDAYAGFIEGVAPGPARGQITAESGALVNINAESGALFGTTQTYGLWARWGGRINQNVPTPVFAGGVAPLAAGGAAAPVTAVSLALAGDILIPLAATNDGSIIQRTVI